MKKIVIALGGNAILSKGEKGTYEEQYNNVFITMKNLLPLLTNDEYKIIITHGNGPQVGNILIQNALAEKTIPSMPMFACGAMTQGQIGFFIQHALNNLLIQKNKNKKIATIVTQVIISDKDSAFAHPSKPVGPFYNKEESIIISNKTKHVFKEDAGRGYRRVVASPEPLKIVEIKTIKNLIKKGVVTICCGGGGIPVIKKNNQLEGIDAVIDKDKAGALLADSINADLFIILTAVEQISLNFNTSNQTDLDKVTIKEAKKYIKEGHFAPGSMLPKVESVIKFVEKNPKRKALITSSKTLIKALKKKTGTWITN